MSRRKKIKKEINSVANNPMSGRRLAELKNLEAIKRRAAMRDKKRPGQHDLRRLVVIVEQ